MMKPAEGLPMEKLFWKKVSKIGALIENPPVYENLSAEKN